MIEMTSSNLSQVQQIELNIQRAKEFVEFGNAVERLRSNRDFKTVIGNGYFKEEAIRLVHLKADPIMQTADKQADIVKQIDAIGALVSFFGVAEHRAAMASKAIEADEEARDELLAEEAE